MTLSGLLWGASSDIDVCAPLVEISAGISSFLMTAGSEVVTPVHSNLGHAPAHYEAWWQALLAIPSSDQNSSAYRRLQRVFRDQTLKISSGPEGAGHQFTCSSHETHYTVCLWENFNLFEPTLWLPELWARAGLATSIGAIQVCNWSYEWCAQRSDQGRRQERNIDVTLRYRDETGDGILVVEAKKPGVVPKAEKDLNPSWYRHVPEFQGMERFSFLYLIDADARTFAEPAIERDGLDVGFLTWEQMAACQIHCARHTALPAVVQSFIAASLYRQYLQLGIDPGMPPLDYLADGPTSLEVVTKTTRTLSGGDWYEPLWRS